MDIDLGNISDKLNERFPQIVRIYLFGSRRYKTRSHRSDIDLLIEFKDHVKQKDILEFSEELSPALDIFKLENGKATSFHNDSFIEYNDNEELLQNLNAVEIWNNKEGRQKADIDWIAKIDERASYPPTSLPNRNYSESDLLDTNLSELEIGQLFNLISKLKTGQFWSLISGLIIVVSAIFSFGYHFADRTSLNQNTNENLSQHDDTLGFNSETLSQINESTTTENDLEDISLPPFSPQIFSTKNTEENISEIRNKNDLREITTFESGKSILELPTNTFFFVSIFYLEEPQFETKTVINTKVQRYNTILGSYFEIQKYSEDEVYLVGYIPESVLSSVSRFDGTTEKKFTVFPSTNELTSHGIIIPFSRIISSDYREIQIDQEKSALSALDLLVQ